MEEIGQLQTALTEYANANNGNFPLYTPGGTGVYCLGLNNGSTCWKGFSSWSYPSGFPGSTALAQALAPYMSIPADPSPTRIVGDRYIYQFGAPSNLECSGGPPIQTDGPFIVWEPENTYPTTDSACGLGGMACCSGLGCGSGAGALFCELDIGK